MGFGDGKEISESGGEKRRLVAKAPRPPKWSMVKGILYEGNVVSALLRFLDLVECTWLW
jgi:hypothetical protein